MEPSGTAALTVSCSGIVHIHSPFESHNLLLSYGCRERGKKCGKQLVVGSGGNSFYLGEVDQQERLAGQVREHSKLG